MTIRDDFFFYYDCYNLMSPHPILLRSAPGSGNGTMYLSEYMIMLSKLKEINATDRAAYLYTITRCTTEEPYTNRVPISAGLKARGSRRLLGGVLNACREIGIRSIPKRFLSALVRHGRMAKQHRPRCKNRQRVLSKTASISRLYD